MPDVMYRKGEQEVRNYNKGDAKVDEQFSKVKAKFPWFDEGVHRAASDEYVHEVLGEKVIRTCVMIATAEEALGKRVMTAHRLFGMDSGTSMFYATVLFDGVNPTWMPEGAYVLGVTEHHEEFGKPVGDKMLGFKEYFFVVPPAVMGGLGIDLTGLNADTLFSALEVNGQVVSYRRYTNYDTEDTGVLANWQMLYVLHCKLAKRMDLARSMFGLPYIHELTDSLVSAG